MLYDCFYLCPYTIEDLKIHTCIIYAHTSTSTHSDIIYKTEGSSNDDGDKGGTDKNDGANQEEESFELEEEIQHIEKLMRNSNDAMILDEKLPGSGEKNAHLNDLRKDPHVIEFFEGKTPNVSDLPELNRALVEARNEKTKELSEAKNYANDKSSTNSLRDLSNSSLHESDNTLNKKEDYHNYSGYKVLPSLLETIIEILNKLFGL
jgi:hypothetical protein